ncbi:hypothetical protein B0H10DRAFT_1940727 [Mycena sp. CBHHK59/15]|nr:hypothetical protein B0H10DRAFT_1940727 [Mycena sp. CBHHK59/15]
MPSILASQRSGVERLRPEEAEGLGFPSLKLNMMISGYSWDDPVYTGLHKFHQGKGFDPDSQDMSWHLEYPLYQLSCEEDTPFAHVPAASSTNNSGSDNVPTLDSDIVAPLAVNHPEPSILYVIPPPRQYMSFCSLHIFLLGASGILIALVVFWLWPCA